jgi:hypothetical protein
LARASETDAATCRTCGSGSGNALHLQVDSWGNKFEKFDVGQGVVSTVCSGLVFLRLLGSFSITRGETRKMKRSSHFRAGGNLGFSTCCKRFWIPACAGMTSFATTY